MTNPTWFEVARRPKWILALLLSLLIAAGFGLLGQWQLDRSFRVVESAPAIEIAVPLLSVATAGEPLEAKAVNKYVSQEIYLDTKNVFIIEKRIQATETESASGYWLVANSFALLDSTTGQTGSLTVALGFAKSLELAEKARIELMESVSAEAFQEVKGRYLQTEAPQDRSYPDKGYLLSSLSLAQLINLYSFESNEMAASFAGFLVPESNPGFGLEKITLGSQAAGTEINWLTLFYALEWTVFAGFAVFLWWRLVEDQRVSEQED